MKRRRILRKLTQEEVNQFLEQQKGLPIRFEGCDLSRLDFSEKRFTDVHFEGCNLNDVRFISSVIEKGNFVNCLLFGVDFTKAYLVNVNFDGCAMQKVNLSEVKIEGVGIKESNLAHSSLKGTEVEFSNRNVFTDVNLHGADLSESKISWFYGEKINFTNAMLEDASIMESHFKDCNFENASMANSEMYSVSFVDCEMQKSDLTTGKITNVTFQKSGLQEADFQQAEIGYGSFMDSNLDGTNFKQANLHSVNEFRNVSMVDADFSEAEFSEESKMHDVDLKKIKVLPAALQPKKEPPEQAEPATEPQNVEIQAKAREQALVEEYERQVTLFTSRYLGSEVNAETDAKIAKELLNQGYLPVEIAQTIFLHSPAANRPGVQGKIYAANAVKRAERDSKGRM